MILVDSSVWIDSFKGRNSAKKWSPSPTRSNCYPVGNNAVG